VVLVEAPIPSKREELTHFLLDEREIASRE